MNLLDNFLNSGRTISKDDPDYYRTRLVNVINFFSIIIVILYMMADILNGDAMLIRIGVYLATLLYLIGITIFIRVSSNLSVAINMGLIVAWVTILYNFIVGGLGDTGAVEAIIFPPVAYTMLGHKIGRRWILLFSASLFLFIVLDLTSIYELPHSNQELLSMVLTYLIVTLIIDLHQAAREQVYNRLKSTKSFSNAVTEALPGLFYVADGDGKLSLWNKSLQEVTGFSGEELKGMLFSDLVAEYDSKSLSEEYAKIKDADSLSREVHIVTKDKRELPYLLTAKYASVEGSDVLIGEAIDLSQLHSMKERVFQLNELQQHVVDISQHKLKPLFDRINSSLDSLLGGAVGELTAEQKDFLNKTREEDELLVNEFSDVITYLDLVEGNRQLDKGETDITVLAASIVSLYESKAMELGVVLDFDSPENRFPLLNVDDSKISYVMENMIGNALTFTEKGGEVKVRLTTDSNRIRFEVEDNGIGIPQGEQDRVFDGFFIASNAKDKGGAGVGLPIAKVYIEMHDGSIGFTSVEGGGSTFWFELPING